MYVKFYEFIVCYYFRHIHLQMLHFSCFLYGNLSQNYIYLDKNTRLKTWSFGSKLYMAYLRFYDIS